MERRIDEVTRVPNHFKVAPKICVNAVIEQRYQFSGSEIGCGGHGKVYIGTEKGCSRKVAIKKLLIGDERKQATFRNEVNIMKQLNHPNICRLYETYEQGRFVHVVMELCEGKEVFDRIFEKGFIEESTTANVVKQVASALKYAHGKKVAHRDIKPENICFWRPNEDHIKVIDWGLGAFFGLTNMTSSVGTPLYAAPEVLEADNNWKYNAGCDVWSLGVLSYVMLCGKPPFWGNNTKVQLQRMKKGVFPMTGDTWDAITDDAKDFIRGTLKAKPCERMDIDDVAKHPWLLNVTQAHMDPTISKQILENMRSFTNMSKFYSLCVASLATQLDHWNLRDIHKVFSDMDTNGDGVLELSEVKIGFGKIFGKDSKECQEVEDMFRQLDLDGDGHLDYTEFCAAGIGERLANEEDFLWTAFKHFDVEGDDNKINKEELERVLMQADTMNLWTPEVCKDVAHDIFDMIDANRNGEIDFDEWKTAMRRIQKKKREEISPACVEAEKEVGEIEKDIEVQRGFIKIYDEVAALNSHEAAALVSPGPSRRWRSATLQFLFGTPCLPCLAKSP